VPKTISILLLVFVSEESGDVEKSDEIAELSGINMKHRRRSTTSKKRRPKKRKRHETRRTRSARIKLSITIGGNPPEATSAGKPASGTGGKGKSAMKKNFLNPAESDNGNVSKNGPASESNSPPLSTPKPKRPRKQYLCSECGRQMKSKSSLDIHVRTHTGDRPFVCPICGREFRANGNLTRHQVVDV